METWQLRRNNKILQLLFTFNLAYYLVISTCFVSFINV